MPQSRAERRKQALARIQRLSCLGIGSEMLMPDLIRELHGLVPSQVRTFFWFDSDLRITNVYGTFPAPIKVLYFEEFCGTRRDVEVWGPYAERMTASGSNPVQRAGDLLRVDQRAYMRSDYYNHLLRPVDAYEPLMIPVREAGRTLGALYVHRAAIEEPFDIIGLRMLESAVDYMAHSITRSTFGEDAFVDSDGRALVLADRDGTLRRASVQARNLLMMALNPRWSPATTWLTLREPVPEIARLCRGLVATAAGEIGQSPPVLRLRNPWGEFIMRAYWLGPTDGEEQTREIGLTIDRRVPRAMAIRRHVEDLALTPREKQLCLLLARDIPQPDLGDAMGLASSTVISHQRSIYAKLGVHSRTELLGSLQLARNAQP